MRFIIQTGDPGYMNFKLLYPTNECEDVECSETVANIIPRIKDNTDLGVCLFDYCGVAT